MSSIVSTRQARVFYHASDLPKEVWDALSENEATANIILPFAKKASKFLREGDNEQLWIVLYEYTNNVVFVLSCTRGLLGNYPIFIVPSKSSARLAKDENSSKDLADSLLLLVLRLLNEVPPQRVFSVFSIAKVAEEFAKIFEAEAHARQALDIYAVKEPLYDATFTLCTSETFNASLSLKLPVRESENVTLDLRRADMSHLEGVKALCKAFSKTSPPYILDDARAGLEAETMITNQQVWVHTMQRDGQDPEIACLVATTRVSDNVVAVTKVFTAEHWRSRGCAARLLHRVCQDILQQKERVVLYVGNSKELASARKMYCKVGFQGLDGQEVEDVERWLEIGFKGTTLGHW